MWWSSPVIRDSNEHTRQDKANRLGAMLHQYVRQLAHGKEPFLMEYYLPTALKSSWQRAIPMGGGDYSAYVRFSQEALEGYWKEGDLDNM